MLTLRFVTKNSEELDFVKELFLEYSESLNENLCFQSFDDELENPLKKYSEPNGRLLLAYCNDEPAGCVALQPLKQDGICEMKRLFVRPAYRNKGIGDVLIKAVLEEAVKKGYRKMVLDTLQRLQSAISLYIKHGFVNTSAYYENPLANVVYMEKTLS